jgi:hypothetical protein
MVTIVPINLRVGMGCMGKKGRARFGHPLMTKGAGDGEIAEFCPVVAVEEAAKWSILGHTKRRFSLCLFSFHVSMGFDWI